MCQEDLAIVGVAVIASNQLIAVPLGLYAILLGIIITGDGKQRLRQLINADVRVSKIDRLYFSRCLLVSELIKYKIVSRLFSNCMALA